VRALLLQIFRLQAESAAEKIGHFIKEMGWTTQLTWSARTVEQRRFDGLRLLMLRANEAEQWMSRCIISMPPPVCPAANEEEHNELA